MIKETTIHTDMCMKVAFARFTEFLHHTTETKKEPGVVLTTM